MATRRRARSRLWTRARRRAVGWERPVCARRASFGLASRAETLQRRSVARSWVQIPAIGRLRGSWERESRSSLALPWLWA